MEGDRKQRNSNKLSMVVTMAKQTPDPPSTVMMPSSASSLSSSVTVVAHRNYICMDCNCVTQNPRVYLEHRRDIHHETLSIHQCELCVYASRHAQKLARHRRTVHRDTLTKQSMVPPPPPPSSSVSGMPQSPPANLLLPMDSSTVVATLKRSRSAAVCKNCNFTSPNKLSMIEHIRGEHDAIEIYNCDQCDYTHYIRDRFQRHRRYHTMDFVVCKFCDFKTIYKWNMERHMKHHGDDERGGFQCGRCNFTASTRQSVTTHETASHQREREREPPAKSKPSIKPDAENRTIKNEIDSENEVRPAHEFLQLAWEAPTAEVDDKRAHIFRCQSCNFKNEVICHFPDSNAKNESDICLAAIQSDLKRYRCGHCGQQSNWKHVIERHCRLVHHELSASIQRFNKHSHTYEDVNNFIDADESQLFKSAEI